MTTNTTTKTKKGQTNVSYDFGNYKVVIRNEATGELHRVRPRKVYWGKQGIRLMHFSRYCVAVLKKLDSRSFPKKTYEIVDFQIA